VSGYNFKIGTVEFGASTLEELEALAQQAPAIFQHVENIKQANLAVQSASAQASTATPAVTVQAAQAPPAQPTPQAVPQYAPPAMPQQAPQYVPQPVAPVPAGPACQHGVKTFKTGVKKDGSQWSAYMCPAPKGTVGQCPPAWL
jgi:hypothetical protein